MKISSHYSKKNTGCLLIRPYNTRHLLTLLFLQIRGNEYELCNSVELFLSLSTQYILYNSFLASFSTFFISVGGQMLNLSTKSSTNCDEMSVYASQNCKYYTPFYVVCKFVLALSCFVHF